MKVLFAARMARFDLLRPVNVLASAITKWTPGCDKALWRLMSYIETTKNQTLVAEVGNTKEEVTPHLYADADFAGCPFSGRSTSGVYLALKGSRTHLPITAISKRQSCVSHSTPEAEM
eukprot:2290666-Amphidinium_carterae.1